MVGIGGFIGGALRESIELIFKNASPIGTLIINLTGTFITVLLTQILVKKLNLLRQIQIDFLFVGIIGAYTTYSTLILEITEMSVIPAIIYMVISLLGGILMVYLAQWVGEEAIKKWQN
ncbi:CrcB family protein [Weissella coleopterorum]|uniref:Fluoride-specific ion channel n=2 Tax=Weissella coleopterorum TaxID=2714949 RepID=A0A6G8B1S4_9LACO|nr:CrcB family protein [Weissella coleopterorum]